jgi:D-proline reductase (dithiol) PrdB
MTQSSANFDRTGFQQDVNVVFPIDRLRELRDAGEVGEIADYHYAINGAGWLPHQIEATAREMAGLLKEDRVNAVLLVPV